MKLILCFSLFLASYAWADEATDRVAIRQLIAAFNDHGKPASDLFTGDTPAVERIVLSAHEEPMSEVTSPKILISSIRSVTPDVALLDAANTQYGSVMMTRSTSLLLVMKKEKGLWRVASVRILGSLGDAITRSK